jgi:hypothetical protein
MKGNMEDDDAYGFFIGRMRQFQAPSFEQIADIIMESNLHMIDVMVMNGKLGTYVKIPACHSKREVCYALNDAGQPKDVRALSFCDHTVSKCISNTKGYEMVTRAKYGCNFHEFISRFVRHKYKHANSSKSADFPSDVFKKAVAKGLLRLMVIEGIRFVEILEDELKISVGCFTREEMEKIIGEVNAINEKANEIVRERVKKGTMRVG